VGWRGWGGREEYLGQKPDAFVWSTKANSSLGVGACVLFKCVRVVMDERFVFACIWGARGHGRASNERPSEG